MGQSWTKSAQILPKNFQTVFLFAGILLLLRISAILDYTGGIRAQKPPKKGYFVNAESVR